MSFHNNSNAFHDDSFAMPSSSSSSFDFDFGAQGHHFDDHLNSLLAADPTLASFPPTSSSSFASPSFASSSSASSMSLPALVTPTLHQQQQQPQQPASSTQAVSSLPMLMPSAADHLIAGLLGDDLLGSPTSASASTSAVDPAKLAGLPADFEADLFALLPDLFGLESAHAQAPATQRNARMPTPAPEDLPALEPPSPKAVPAPLSRPHVAVSQPVPAMPSLMSMAAQPPAASLTMPMLPSMAPQPMVPMLASAAVPAAASAAPQLYSVVNVTGPNNQATTLLVPVSAAAAAPTPTPAAAPMFAPAPPTAALPAVAQTAAASLSAYHQHRLQEAAAAAAAAAAASASGAASSAKPNSLAAVKSAVAAAAAAASASSPAGLKPLLPAAPAAAAPAAIVPAKKPESAATKDSAAKRKLEIPDEVLEYPSHLIPLDAPIQKKRKRSAGGEPETDAAAELAADEDELTPETAKRIKNTLSARHSRARRAAKMNFLESRVVDLETENEQLKAELAEAKRVVAEMKAQMMGKPTGQVQLQPQPQPHLLVRGMPPRI